MANPQKENGYTQIATEILEALAKKQVPLSDHEWKILMFLFRKTYGWHKRSEQISLSQFAEGTNTHRNHISRSLQKLLKKNFICATQIGATQNKKYHFQKDHEKWQGAPKQVAPSRGTQIGAISGTQIGSRGGTRLGIKGAPKQGPTKNTTKDKQKKQKKKEFILYKEPEISLENILATMDDDIDNLKSLGNSKEWIKKTYLNLGVSEAQIDKALGRLF